jgi:hypothetical protein
LICSGVFIRAARAMRSFDVGYRTHGVIAMELSQKARLKVLSHLAAAPAVESIASALLIPLRSGPRGLTISSGAGRTALRAWHNHVSPEFFHLLEIPILEGRNFTADEAKAAAPVAIISELAARSLWPKGDAVGREIRIQSDPQDNEADSSPEYSAVRITGVAKNVITSSILDGQDAPLVYFPSTVVAQNPILIRVRGDAETARRTLLRDLDATLPGAIVEARLID